MDGYAKLIGGFLLVVLGAVLGIVGALGYAMFSEYQRIEQSRKRAQADSFDRALNKFLRDLDNRKKDVDL